MTAAKFLWLTAVHEKKNFSWNVISYHRLYVNTTYEAFST